MAEADYAPTTAERIARNDAIFREANEGIAESAADGGIEEGVPFICECAEPACRELVRMSLEEYAEVRSDPRWFLNAVGHQTAARGWAVVIREMEGYVVVEKIGRAGDVAAELAGEDAQELA